MKAKVIEIIDSEIEYARKWDAIPKDKRPLMDAEKPIEFWLLHIENYLRLAQDGCKEVDKTTALENIRKITALCVRCMENNDTPKRIP